MAAPHKNHPPKRPTYAGSRSPPVERRTGRVYTAVNAMPVGAELVSSHAHPAKIPYARTVSVTRARIKNIFFFSCLPTFRRGACATVTGGHGNSAGFSDGEIARRVERSVRRVERGLYVHDGPPSAETLVQETEYAEERGNGMCPLCPCMQHTRMWRRR